MGKRLCPLNSEWGASRRNGASERRRMRFAFSQMSRAERRIGVSARGKLSRKLFLFFALSGSWKFHIGLTTACETEKDWRVRA